MGIELFKWPFALYCVEIGIFADWKRAPNPYTWLFPSLYLTLSYMWRIFNLLHFE